MLSALSIMVNRPIGMNVPKLKIHFNEVEDILGSRYTSDRHTWNHGDKRNNNVCSMTLYPKLSTLIFGREDLEINKIWTIWKFLHLRK